MASKGRIGLFLVFAACVAAGAYVFVYLRQLDEEAMTKEGAPIEDASADARAVAAKGKGKGKAPTKKRAVRGGKTRVTARAPAHAPTPTNTAGTAHGAGNHPSAPDRPGAPDENESQPAEPHAPPAPHKHHYASPTGASYESALDSNNQHVVMGANAGADLTDAQLSGPMSDGTFIGECDAPDDMEITVKVAIKNGRAVGVSVFCHPPSRDVAACIDHHVRGLSWPASPKMDSLVTTY
jgi:hypothetical protein